jgi:hypothetical protein
MIVSHTASACATSAFWDLSSSSARKPPANSKERCVVVWFAGVVPMSWSRAVSRRVSGLHFQVGKCWAMMARPAVFKSAVVGGVVYFALGVLP